MTREATEETMDRTFRCDMCRQDVPLVERYSDGTVSTAGRIICRRCGFDLQERLVQQVKPWGRLSAPITAASSPFIAQSIKGQETSTLPRKDQGWAFPHIRESGYQPHKRSRSLIDNYTASYMRWESRAHVVAWLKSFEHPQALQPVFLDTETTGAQRFSEIIEICLIDWHGRTLFYSLVNPTTEIEPIASAVHGLTRADVKDAPRYPDIHEEVMRYMQNSVVVAYNASFDIRILRQTSDCYELNFPLLHVGCLMYAYAKYRELYTQWSNGQRRRKIHRLEEAMKYEMLDLLSLHRAERDALCVYQLFQVMKSRN